MDRKIGFDITPGPARMSTLVKTLQRFNRKERNWLIRDALGDGAKTLSSDFRGRLASVLQKHDPATDIPADAWWTTDYHIDWLIGCLTILAEGESTIDVAKTNEPPIVKGSQQDIDLLIAWETTLVLIEAKGVGSWKGSGTTSKLSRLCDLPDSLFSGLRPYLLFMSPGDGNLPGEKMPKWIRNSGKADHLELRLPPTDKPLLRVERCSLSKGKWRPNARGTDWRIEPAAELPPTRPTKHI
ncbi:hypothetical protein AB4Z10_27315 [Bosea sp. RAF48]|uniref:hypothetical protein n=1 Tax=Bosea sp. RAF48 TaxID=3237480 RepID=UPI003F929FD5